MLFSTPSQFVVLGLLLVIGWLFGFASAPGGRKWRVAMREQEQEHAAWRSEAENDLRDQRRRIAALEQELTAAHARRADDEATIAELRRVPPAPPPAEPVATLPAPSPERDDPPALPAPPPAPPAAPRTDAPVAASAASPAFPMTPTPSEASPAPIGPAEPAMPAKGWFGGSRRDDLTRIRGIDAPMNTRLFGLGVTRYEDVEKLSDEDEMALEQRLGVPVGFIGREQWRHQAALLRGGNDDEHRERFGEG